MLLSDILLEKLNSDAELLKRVRLAQNVFVSGDLRIAYKEEYILLWFLKSIAETKDDDDDDDEDKRRILCDGFCLVVQSDAMASLPSSGVRAAAKSNISKHLAKLAKTVKTTAALFDSVLTLVKKFFLHFKSHPKQFVAIMLPLMSDSASCHEKQCEILSLASEIFRSGAQQEKFVLHLLRKDFRVLFESDLSDDVVRFLQRMFFRKDALAHVEKTFAEVCSEGGAGISVEGSAIRALVGALHGIHVSDAREDVKIRAFSKVFQSFATSCDTTAVFHCFLVMCHLVGVEQTVRHARAVVNEDRFREAFNAEPPPPNDASYAVARDLIRCLSRHSPDLSSSTYADWFHSFVRATVNVDSLSRQHLEFFRACSDLDATLVEKNFKSIFSCVLKQSPDKFRDCDFAASYNSFMDSTLKVFSKLQRVQKFVSKLLSSARTTPSGLSLNSILPDSLIAEFTGVVSLLPSSNTVKFADELIETLCRDCVEALEESSGSVNALLTQLACSLASAFLCGVRVLNHSVPKNILRGFVDEVSKLKTVLGRFGRALLVRIHDREIVQPFLNLSFHWGEFELLVVNYAEEYSEVLSNKDISPTDLSTLHSYLSGEEWNVLAERVSNFGAVHCYRLFLKLILQKLRLARLKKCHALVNVEATCKYVLVQLTSELYKHDIVEELTPEDFGFVCDFLSASQCDLLLDKLYSRGLDSDGRKLLDWIAESSLAENVNFSVLSFAAILRRIGISLGHASLALDFLDENLHLVRKNFRRLVASLDEAIGSGATSPARDCAVLVEIATRVIPVRCLPREVQPLALTALVYLAAVLGDDGDALARLLPAIRDVATALDDVASCLNVGLCLEWLLLLRVRDEHAAEAKSAIARALLKKAAIADKALDELSRMVRGMRKKDVRDRSKVLEFQVRLYQDLGKCWIKNKRRASENEGIARFRSRLSKRIRRELERQFAMDSPSVDAEVLVAAYATEMTRAVKMKADLAALIRLNFADFFEAAVAKVGNGSADGGYFAFLSTLLVHWTHVRSHASEDSLRRLWSALRFHPKIDRGLLHDLASDNDVEYFFEDLLATWTVFPESSLDAGAYLGAWRDLCSAELTKGRNAYETYLKRLFAEMSASLTTIRGLSADKATSLFDFLRFCISTPEIAMTSSMLDASLDVANAYAGAFESVAESGDFERAFKSCVNATSWMCTTRVARTRDKVHVVFEIFARLVSELARRSSAERRLSDDDLMSLSSCAYHVEKWSSIMAKRQAEFARVSVYFIAELVSSFVRVSIYPAVKDPLVNGINNFLTIADAHDVGHLSRVLDPGSQQIFNGIYDKYNKYYKFTGKA